MIEPTRAQLHRAVSVAMHAERYDEALAASEEALGRWPDDAQFLLRKAVLLRLSGQPAKAREIAREAIRLAPTWPDAHAEVGLAFLDEKKLNNAESSFKKALEYDRSNPDALRGLGQLRLKQRRLAEAEATIMDAIRSHPRDEKLFIALGDILGARGNHSGMIECYRSARDTNPMSTEANEKYVAAKQEVGGLEAARQALEEAVARMPEVPQVHVRLGRFLTENGMLDEGHASLRTALALNPSLVGAIPSFAESKKFTSTEDPDYQVIAESYRLTEPDSRERAVVSFALAKASDDVKDYDRAFDAYLEGNTIHRKRMDFSMDRERKSFEVLEKAFTAEWLSASRGRGNPSAAPIFIVGMPRSGTTLTETVLARAPGVYAAGELDAISVASTGVVGVNPVYDAAKFVERVKAKDWAEIGSTYLQRLVDDARNSPRMTDKMPHNFRLLPVIRLALPNAKIVHVRRDPVDNCLSMFKADFAADALGFAFDLVELGHYYNFYRRLMQHWRSVLPGQFFEVDYEALVSDPENTTRALFAYCDLEWSPQVISIEENRREVRTASYAQVRRPINTASVSAAARYGSRLDPLRAALDEWDEAHS